MFSEMDKVFDSHELYNKWQVFEGMRESTGGTQPIAYICAVKMKKKFKKFSSEELEELFEQEFDNDVMIDRHQKMLIEKTFSLHDWQVFYAFGIFEDENKNYTDCAKYILQCKLTDEEPNTEKAD